MASAEKTLVSRLILACLVYMAMAVAPRPDDVSYRVKRESAAFTSAYARDCKPDDMEEPMDPYYNGRLVSYFQDCFIYDGHKYYLSSDYYYDVKWSQWICRSIDGHLVQIDTNSELKAIRDYVKNVSAAVDFRAILIDGTDSWEEGLWTFFNIMPLPVLGWYPGAPDGGDCLCLSATDTQMMFDVWCYVPEDWRGPRYPYLYMCEVPA